MEFRFDKMHGLGNDFAVFEDWGACVNLTPAQATLLCDRHFGIGADGLIFIRSSRTRGCRAFMHYLNADGTLAQMCGNGIRCMAKYLVDHGFVDDGQPFVDIETRAGVRRVSIMRDDMGRFESATVDMGTPEFAVESLKCLVEGGYNVVGVVTMPDKPMGRHQDVLQASPVKQYAVEHGLRVLQPVKLKDEAFVEELRSLRADLQIVVAFRMLPEVVWNMPPMGTFNLHASLLPQYRGAAPINWAVINGETETGITTFFLKHEIDTGEVIQQVRIPIADTDNVGVVHDKLMELGGRLVVETVDHILTDTIRPIPQEEMAVKGPLHPAPKIFKETCRMDWQGRPLKPLYDFVRGLSPYPAAWSEMKDEATGKVYTLKIYETEKEPCVCHEPAGKVVSDGKTYLKVAVDGGYLRLKEIQLTGKKRMRIEDFLRGFRMPENLLML